jgi:hypothetical protein
MVFGIIFNFSAFILNIASAYVNYTKGIFLWAVINGVCIGVSFMNFIWMLILKIKEDL